MKWLVTQALLLFIFGLVCRSSSAQSAPGEFRFEHLTVNDGLSHSDAMAVVQDRAGFIWVGTNRGINRYDGYGLKKYILPVNSTNGLSGNRVRAFHVGATGRLWVGAESSGLSYYDADHDRFLTLKEHFAPPAYRALARQLTQADVVGITSDAHGRLWVGTQHDGIFALSFNAQEQLVDLRHIGLAENGERNYQVLSLVATPEGQIWVGTLGSGLRLIDAGASLPTSLMARAAPLGFATVRAVHLDRRGDLWIGTTHQVFWVSRRNRLSVRDLASHPLPQACRDIHDLRLDSFGRLWVGTDYGLYLWEANVVTGIAPPLQPTKPTLFLPVGGDPFSLQSERVHQLFEDQNQVLWLAASAGGLNRVDLRQKPFGQLQHQLTSEPTLPNNYVNAIYKEEAKNLLWIGTRNGFSRYDLARKTYHNYLSWQQSGDGTGVDVSSIVQASDGTLWLGTRTHGLYTLKQEGGREALARFAALSTQPDKVATSIESIVEDRYQTMWVATFNAGLARFSRAGKHLKTYRRAAGLPTDHFTCLLYDRKKDVLWASTRDAGLLKLRVTADSLVLLKRFAYDKNNVNSLSVNYTWPLLQDKHGTLWIGTIGGGLHQLNTDAQGHETIRRCSQWMPESDVESMLADEEGNLWIGGTGLYRVTPTTH